MEVAFELEGKTKLVANSRREWTMPTFSERPVVNGQIVAFGSVERRRRRRGDKNVNWLFKSALALVYGIRKMALEEYPR